MFRASLKREKRTLADVLTPRQFTVATLVAAGHNNTEIAQAMRISRFVVKNYLRTIYDRSGCGNRLELALLYVHEFETGLYRGIKMQDDKPAERKVA